jgi:hypothetical protein
MARQKKPDPDQLEFEDRPVVLFGQPSNLRGEIVLRNRGEDRLALRWLPLTPTGPKDAPLGLQAARPGQALNVRLRPAFLRPGLANQISLSLELDAHTPPGEYQAEAQVFGRSLPVVVYVTERVFLDVSPSVLTLENRPNQRFNKQVVFHNRGNVPLSIGELGAVFLDDDLLICRSLRAAAAAVGDELRELEEYLAQILLSTKQVAEHSGVLRIHNQSGKDTLQPGEVRAVNLEIRVPDGLYKRGRYRGVVALYNTDLTFVVVPVNGPVVSADRQVAKEKPPKKKSGSTVD